MHVQKKITLSNGERIALWSSPDALILKVLTILIQKWLAPNFSKRCYHLKGHGGLKGAIGRIEGQLAYGPSRHTWLNLPVMNCAGAGLRYGSCFRNSAT